MIQSGYNSKYPESIEIWRYNETPIPSWLSDSCKITRIDDFGNPILETRGTNTGGLEFISADGINVVVRTKNKDDLICYGDGRIFSLTQDQLELLYE